MGQVGERSVGALPKEFPPRDPFTQIDFSRIFCPDNNWYKKKNFKQPETLCCRVLMFQMGLLAIIFRKNCRKGGGVVPIKNIATGETS